MATVRAAATNMPAFNQTHGHKQASAEGNVYRLQRAETKL